MLVEHIEHAPEANAVSIIHPRIVRNVGLGRPVLRQILVPGADLRCTLSLTHASRCWAARRSTANGTIWWNFVSSSKHRIEQAKEDWKEGRFPKVPGGEAEFIPLPG
jgi:hypothetical protein